MRLIILFYMAVLGLFSCKSARELPTVKEVNLEKYSGKWSEIAKLPNRFQKGLDCATATYTIMKNGKIEVVNQAYVSEDKSKIKKIKGTAWVPDPAYPGKLKVRFFWPFSGDYYIIYLDEQYNHVLVGAPSRKYLWVLSRSKQMDDDTYNKLLGIAKANGFDINKVIKEVQGCN